MKSPFNAMKSPLSRRGGGGRAERAVRQSRAPALLSAGHGGGENNAATSSPLERRGGLRETRAEL